MKEKGLTQYCPWGWSLVGFCLGVLLVERWNRTQVVQASKKGDTLLPKPPPVGSSDDDSTGVSNLGNSTAVSTTAVDSDEDTDNLPSDYDGDEVEWTDDENDEQLRLQDLQFSNQVEGLKKLEFRYTQQRVNLELFAKLPPGEFQIMELEDTSGQAIVIGVRLTSEDLYQHCRSSDMEDTTRSQLLELDLKEFKFENPPQEIPGNQTQTLKKFREWGQGQLDDLQKLQFTPSQQWDLADGLSQVNQFKIHRRKQGHSICVVRSTCNVLYERTIDNQRLDSVVEELGTLGCKRSYDTYVGNLYGDRDERRALSELNLKDCQEHSQRTSHIPCRSFAIFVEEEADKADGSWLVTIYARANRGSLSSRTIRCQPDHQGLNRQIVKLQENARKAGFTEVEWGCRGVYRY